MLIFSPLSLSLCELFSVPFFFSIVLLRTSTHTHPHKYISTIYILTITWWKWKCRAENKIYSNSRRTNDSMTIFFSELKQFFCCLLAVQYVQHCWAHGWMFKCLFHSWLVRIKATESRIFPSFGTGGGCLLPHFSAPTINVVFMRARAPTHSRAHTHTAADKCIASNMKRARHIRYRRSCCRHRVSPLPLPLPPSPPLSSRCTNIHRLI